MRDLTDQHDDQEELFRALMAEYGMSRLTEKRRILFENTYNSLAETES